MLRNIKTAAAFLGDALKSAPTKEDRTSYRRVQSAALSAVGEVCEFEGKYVYFSQESGLEASVSFSIDIGDMLFPGVKFEPGIKVSLSSKGAHMVLTALLPRYLTTAPSADPARPTKPDLTRPVIVASMTGGVFTFDAQAELEVGYGWKADIPVPASLASGPVGKQGAAYLGGEIEEAETGAASLTIGLEASVSLGLGGAYRSLFIADSFPFYGPLRGTESGAWTVTPRFRALTAQRGTDSQELERKRSIKGKMEEYLRLEKKTFTNWSSNDVAAMGWGYLQGLRSRLDSARGNDRDDYEVAVDSLETDLRELSRFVTSHPDGRGAFLAQTARTFGGGASVGLTLGALNVTPIQVEGSRARCEYRLQLPCNQDFSHYVTADAALTFTKVKVDAGIVAFERDKINTKELYEGKPLKDLLQLRYTCSTLVWSAPKSWENQVTKALAGSGLVVGQSFSREFVRKLFKAPTTANGDATLRVDEKAKKVVASLAAGLRVPVDAMTNALTQAAGVLFDAVSALDNQIGKGVTAILVEAAFADSAPTPFELKKAPFGMTKGTIECRGAVAPAISGCQPSSKVMSAYTARLPPSPQDKNAASPALPLTLQAIRFRVRMADSFLKESNLIPLGIPTLNEIFGDDLKGEDYECSIALKLKFSTEVNVLSAFDLCTVWVDPTRLATEKARPADAYLGAVPPAMLIPVGVDRAEAEVTPRKKKK